MNTSPGVNPKNLKVYGIDNLRIVDASIFPKNPYDNPQATSFCIALIGSEMICKDMP